MGWLTGWQYRRPITITEQNGTDLTDFSIRIKLDSSNFDFSKVNSDGSDIRFTSSDGTTLLPHYIESWDSVNTIAYVWVKVPSILANGSTTIYMYYGNSSASSASSYDAFEYFEDFSTDPSSNSNYVLDGYYSWDSTNKLLVLGAGNIDNTKGSISMLNLPTVLGRNIDRIGVFFRKNPLGIRGYQEGRSEFIYFDDANASSTTGWRQRWSNYSSPYYMLIKYVNGTSYTLYSESTTYDYSDRYYNEIFMVDEGTLTEKHMTSEGWSKSATSSETTNIDINKLLIGTWQGKFNLDFFALFNTTVPEPGYSIGSEEIGGGGQEYSVNVTDSLSMNEVRAFNIDNRIQDNVVLSESRGLLSSKLVFDISSLSDSKEMQSEKVMLENFVPSDSRIVMSEKRRIENIVLSENFVPVYSGYLEYSEVVSVTDKILSSIDKSLLSAVSVIEALVKDLEFRRTEGIVVSDALSKEIMEVYSEVVSVLDEVNALLVGVQTLVLSDLVSVTENRLYNVSTYFEGVVNVQEIGSKVVSKESSDSMSLLDKGIRLPEKLSIESVQVNENIVKSIDFVRLVNVLLGDVVSKGVQFEKIDSMALSDNIEKLVNIANTDTVTVSDVFEFLNVLSLVLSDIVSLVEGLKKNIELNRVDEVTFSEDIFVISALVTAILDLVSRMVKKIEKAISLEIEYDVESRIEKDIEMKVKMLRFEYL